MGATSFLEEKKIEILGLSTVVIISFVFRLFLLVDVAHPMYFYDSYSYYLDAWSLLKFGTLPSSRAIYVFLLAGGLYLLSFLGDPLFAARIFVLFLSLLVVCVVYLLGRKVMPRSYALIASLLVSLEPRFLSLSITTHNDIFFILTGLSSLYFSTCRSKGAYLILAPICFVISTLSSEWIYVLLGPALLLIYLSRISRSNSTRLRKYTFSIMAVMVYLALFLLPGVQSFYYSGTRFSPIQKVSLFLTPDLVSFTLAQILGIVVENESIDLIFAIIVLSGSFIILIDFIKSRARFPHSWESDRCSREMGRFVAFILVMVLCLCVFFITVFTMSYEIIDGQLVIIKEFNLRYVTLPRVFSILIFVYLCSKIVMTFRGAHIPRIDRYTHAISRSQFGKTFMMSRRLRVSPIHNRTPKAGSVFEVTVLIALVVFASGFAYSGYNLTSNSSAILANFGDASVWLEQNMKDGEMAMVPFISVFYSLAPELYGRLIHYSVVWTAAGIVLTASVSAEDIMVVRETLAQLLLNATEIQYLAFDTLDPYAQLVFSISVTDQLSLMLSNLTTFPLRSDWTNPVKIFTVDRP